MFTVYDCLKPGPSGAGGRHGDANNKPVLFTRQTTTGGRPEQRNVELLDLRRGRVRKLISGYRALGWAPDGREVLIYDERVRHGNRHIQLLDPETNTRRPLLQGRGFFSAISWAASGRAAIVTYDSHMYRLNVRSGKTVPVGPQTAVDAALSPDGCRIADATDADHDGVVANGEATQPATELHLLDLRNNVDTELTHTKDIDDDQPTWLSNRQVVFVRDDRRWRLDTISTIARQLTGPTDRREQRSSLDSDPSIRDLKPRRRGAPKDTQAPASSEAQPGSSRLHRRRTRRRFVIVASRSRHAAAGDHDLERVRRDLGTVDAWHRVLGNRWRRAAARARSAASPQQIAWFTLMRTGRMAATLTGASADPRKRRSPVPCSLRARHSHHRTRTAAHMARAPVPWAGGGDGFWASSRSSRADGGVDARGPGMSRTSSSLWRCWGT